MPVGVSDFVHTKAVIRGLYDALLGTGGSNISCDSSPMLYRLPPDAAVVEAPRSAEEIIPVQGVEQVVDKALEWMREWVREDEQLYPPANYTSLLSDLNVRFACPNVISMPFPQQLVEIQMTAEMAGNAFYCLEMAGIPSQPLGVQVLLQRLPQVHPSVAVARVARHRTQLAMVNAARGRR